jgi:hypothetical protein
MASGLPVAWGHQFDQAPAALPYLWQGYLAPGQVTLLTSPPKFGKTTLLSVLLHRLREGGTLAGQPLRPGRAVVVSEETTARWQERRARLTPAEQVCFVCRPFRTKPLPAQWEQLLSHLLLLHDAHRFDLVVLDSLAAFLPGREESHAALMMERLLLLQCLTDHGLGVLLLHHPRRAPSAPGLSSRGSIALPGFADILLELQRYPPAEAGNRRRLLLAFSRDPQTPPRRLLELNADGTDYVCLEEEEGDDEFALGWRALRLVLEDARSKLTRADVLEQWPPDFPRPGAVTLWRWLERASAEGRVCRSGSGRRHDAFRYWLPGREGALREDPMRQWREEQERLMERLRREG